MIKMKCIKKVRDNKGNIVKYQLVGDDGSRIEATSKEIKAEMRAGRYEFINLQIDKAGRLVNKAMAKTPVPAVKKTPAPAVKDVYFTVEDLICHNVIEDKKVKFIYNNKEYVGIGTGYRTNRESDQLHNAVNVYCEDLGQVMVVDASPIYEQHSEEYIKFWHDYNRAAYVGNNIIEKTRLALNFYKNHKDEIELHANNGHKVDAAPNPDGLYTILKRGSIEGEPTDICLLKYTRDDSKPHWEKIDIDWVDAYNNEYTNVAVSRENLVMDDIEVVPFDKLKTTSDKIVEKYKAAVDYIIKAGSFWSMGEGDDYLGNFSKEQQDALGTLRKNYDDIWGKGRFDQEIVNYALETTRRKNVYYAGVVDGDEFIISKNQLKVVEWYWNRKEELRHAGYPAGVTSPLLESNIDIWDFIMGHKTEI